MSSTYSNQLDRQYKKLREMSRFECILSVYRGAQDFIKTSDDGTAIEISEEINSRKMHISSLHILPGDLIEIPDGGVMPCDLILLNGSCIVNEAMLTGESIPVMKIGLPFNNNRYNANDDGRMSTIFAGTKCIETR